MKRFQFFSAMILGFVFSTSLALAAAPKVEVTSFVYPEAQSRFAELCGKVTDAVTSPVFLRVVVDYKGKRPGVYNVLVGTDGKFCTTVVSYSGLASVDFWGTSANGGSPSPVATQASRR